ncbi:hypothetical protein G6011_09444 [Alternaria panax]|uniref:Fungal N-terminal domain-containing protein n=1 Tax=Alternaria panax TaxID=48097 RepID=A0AAD4IB68_9PLEO|nr:hypothetical protein G6011_09444 [Alternaria panax]
MPVTFGAVGDIISVVLLVKDLVVTLDEARGSKAEYKAAIRDLWLLDCTLLEIDLLTRKHSDGATPELRSLCETAKRAVVRCNELVSTFSKRIGKYKKTFDQNQEPSKLGNVVMAVRWRLGEKEALERFHVHIVGTISSLQMLMITANMYVTRSYLENLYLTTHSPLMGINRREMNNRFDEAKGRDDTAILLQDTAISTIRDGIENANRNIDAGNLVLGKLSEMIKLDWLRQLGSELKSLMRSAMAVNFAT